MLSLRFNCTLSTIVSLEYRLKVNDEKIGEMLFCEIHTDEVLGNKSVVTSFCLQIIYTIRRFACVLLMSVHCAQYIGNLNSGTFGKPYTEDF